MRRAVSHQSSLRHPLSEVLGAFNNVRVVRAMAGHGGELSTTEISRLSGVAVQNVRTIVDSLVNFRILREIGSGRSRVFRIVDTHPLIPGIKALFEAEERRFRSVLQVVREAAAHYAKDVLAVWLYGSVARAEDGPRSDLDIVVVTAPQHLNRVVQGLREQLRAAEESYVFTASVVGIDTGDVVRLNSQQDGWWLNMIADALPLAGPAPQTLVAKLQRKSP